MRYRGHDIFIRDNDIWDRGIRFIIRKKLNSGKFKVIKRCNTGEPLHRHDGEGNKLYKPLTKESALEKAKKHIDTLIEKEKLKKKIDFLYLYPQASMSIIEREEKRLKIIENYS